MKIASLFAALTLAVVCRAQTASSLFEDALVDYAKTFRKESTVLLTKISSEDTRRAYTEIVEQAAHSMTIAQKEFEEEFRRFLTSGSGKNLALRLRVALAAQEKTSKYLSKVTFSNSVLFALCSFTHSYAAPEADQQCFAILKSAGELHAILKTQIEALVTEIDQELKKLRSTVLTWPMKISPGRLSRSGLRRCPNEA
jgi:hypothetical protein